MRAGLGPGHASLSPCAAAGASAGAPLLGLGVGGDGAEPRAVPAVRGGAAPACAGASLRAILCKQQCSALSGATRLPKTGSGFFLIPVFAAFPVMQRPVWGAWGASLGSPERQSAPLQWL